MLIYGISGPCYVVCHIKLFMEKYSWLWLNMKGSDMGSLAQKASNKRKAFLRESS
jgi:hypothetical protein